LTQILSKTPSFTKSEGASLLSGVLGSFLSLSNHQSIASFPFLEGRKRIFSCPVAPLLHQLRPSDPLWSLHLITTATAMCWRGVSCVVYFLFHCWITKMGSDLNFSQCLHAVQNVWEWSSIIIGYWTHWIWRWSMIKLCSKM
jgi:hypothetical protein